MIRKILAEHLGIDQDGIKPEQDIMKDLGADSLDIVELVMEVEEQYGIDIPDEDAEELKTVGDIEKYIEDNS